MDQQQKNIPSSLSFKVSPRTMQMLGRENISSPVIAVLELVKNAYDADASEVLVRFHRASQQNGSISIEDNGEGMDLADLREKWMVISTDNKARNRLTQAKKRVKVGEKGIGRLAMDRLCRRAAITTWQDDQSRQGLQIDLDWDLYERDSGELQDVEHPLSLVPAPKNKRSGTIIHLTDLRDQWTSADYKKLYSDLTLLVAPFEHNIDGFTIKFECDEQPKLSGHIRNPMSEAAEYVLNSTLNKDGMIHHRLAHRSGYTVESRRPWGGAFSTIAPDAKPVCGPLQFSLYFYLRDGATIRGTELKRADLIEFLNRFQGVRIYRDNFRVKPYGDPSGEGDKDWLGLNWRRVRNPAGVGRPGYVVGENQIVGSILITQEHNPRLRDQTNREGLFENLAFQEMKDFILHGIRYLETERYNRQKTNKTSRDIDKPKDVELAMSNIQGEITDLSSAVTEIRNTARSIPPLFAQEETARIQQVVDIAEVVLTSTQRVADQVVAVQKMYQDEVSERQLMLGLATLGITMAVFGHETVQSVDTVLNRAELLRRLTKSLAPELREQFQKNILVLIESARQVETWGTFALDRVRRDKRTRKNIAINPIIEDVLGPFARLFETMHVAQVVELDDRLPLIRGFAMDIEGILINLITNAIDAMQFTPLEKRQIRIRTLYDGTEQEIALHFADSGRGILDEDTLNIFEPLFTTKKDKSGGFIGTGMGLTIVRDIVDMYKGRIDVVGRSDLGGAEFRVVVPAAQNQEVQP
jgi:signal transduction histidine kinase